jgi:uncharacterized integral membrane protein
MKSRIQSFALVFLTTAIIFFALQNLHTVPVALLIWDFQASVSLLVLFPLLAGLLVGGGTAIWLEAVRRARARREAKEAVEEPPKEIADDVVIPLEEPPEATTAEIKDEEEIGA